MPLPNIKQPEIIDINGSLRLRAYDGKYISAIPWYQDELVRRYSEGLMGLIQLVKNISLRFLRMVNLFPLAT